MSKKKINQLQQSFLKGVPPKELHGFYRGKLELLIPGNIVESLAGFIAKFWLPWYGKEFNKHQQRGDNLLPSYLLPLIRFRYKDIAILGKDKDRIHVFPFRTKIKEGLQDAIQVLQLDYDLQENPSRVRDVIDELVSVGRNAYLGKAYIRKGKDFRLAAFFSLEK